MKEINELTELELTQLYYLSSKLKNPEGKTFHEWIRREMIRRRLIIGA